MSTTERIREADAYLSARTGRYELRCERYDAALAAMHAVGLDNGCTVVDVGAGMGEFGARLHTGTAWGLMPSRARYVPVDAAIDGTDLDGWVPPREADWFVCLEVLEHLRRPFLLVNAMKQKATRGIVVSTPNCETVDVLGMDATHCTIVERRTLEVAGFKVREASFYGKPADSLLGVWTP